MGEATVDPHNTKRKCTDIAFLLLFIFFWVGMGLVAYQGIQTGNPRLLLYPENSEGALCGYDNSADGLPNFASSPNLYFVDPFNSSAPQVCVETCPTSSTLILNITEAICRENYIPSNITDLLSKQLDGDCALFVYSSEPVLHRCSPSNTTVLLELAGQSDISGATVDVQDTAQQIVGDFARTWWFVLSFAVVAAVISLVWIVLLRYFTGFFVWFVVIAVLLCIDGLAVFFYFAWTDAQGVVAAAVNPTEGQTREEQTYFGMFIAACSLAVIINLVLLFMRKRLKIAIQVIKEASKVVKAMPSMIFFPIIMFTLMLMVYGYWFLVELYLASSNVEPSFFGVTYSNEILKYLQWYHLFGLFWTIEFLSGINQASISGAVATWYWSQDKRALPSSPILKSLGRVLRYHLGSVAVGSLLIATIQLIRAVLYYVERSLKGKENKVTKALLACCQCCFACVEKVFKFINKNAYIQMATFGNSFCYSAKNSFQLLVRNAFRLIAIDMVSGFILFLSKLVVTCISGAGSYYALDYWYRDDPLYYPSATVFVIMVASFVIASIFMYVHGMAIDTIFLSFCHDVETNDGTEERPFFMTKDMQQIANAKNMPVDSNQVRPGSAEHIMATSETKEAFVEDL